LLASFFYSSRKVPRIFPLSAAKSKLSAEVR